MKDKKTKLKDENVNALREALDELKQGLKSVQTEKDELFGKLQRVSADFANFQKRVPKQISDSVAYEKESMIRTLLPVLDNFEHTLQKAHSAESLDVVIQGVEMIYGQILDILKSHGVEQIHAQNETFDPTQNEAMMRREDDVVLEEFHKGYKVNGRVIRPAKVIVNKVQAEPRPEPPAEAPKEEAPEQATDGAEATSEPENDTEQ